MWLKELKIAIVEKNIQKLDALMMELPSFEQKNEINEAQYLINEAKKIVVSLKNDTKHSMIQIKKNIEFLNATEAPFRSTLDITS